MHEIPEMSSSSVSQCIQYFKEIITKNTLVYNKQFIKQIVKKQKKCLFQTMIALPSIKLNDMSFSWVILNSSSALFAMETQVPRSLIFQDPCFLQSKWKLGNYLEVFTRTEQLQKKQDA